MSDFKKLLAAKKMSGQLDELLTGLSGALEKVQNDINSEPKARDDKFNELSVRVEKLEKAVESLNRSITALSDIHI